MYFQRGGRQMAVAVQIGRYRDEPGAGEPGSATTVQTFAETGDVTNKYSAWALAACSSAAGSACSSANARMTSNSQYRVGSPSGNLIGSVARPESQFIFLPLGPSN
jgi:hypothetical protein